jgi:hypothetical protein
MPKSYWLNIGPYPIGLPSFGITFSKMSERRYEAFEKTTGSSVDAPVPEAPPVPSTTPKLDTNYHLVVVALAFEKTTGSSVDAPVPEAPVPSTTPKLDANYHLVVVALLLSIMNKKDLFEIEKWKR